MVFSLALPSFKHETGSTLPTEVQQPGQYTNRKLLPYNILALQSYSVIKEARHRGFEDFPFKRWQFEPATITVNKDTLPRLMLTVWTSLPAMRLCPCAWLCSFSASRH